MLHQHGIYIPVPHQNLEKKAYSGKCGGNAAFHNKINSLWYTTPFPCQLFISFLKEATVQIHQVQLLQQQHHHTKLTQTTCV